MDHSSLITAIASVQRLEGVAGAMLFKGRNAIHKHMPFSDGRTLDVMDVLGEMLEGYRQVKRRVRQVFFQFDGGVLLVLVQDPRGVEAREGAREPHGGGPQLASARSASGMSRDGVPLDVTHSWWAARVAAMCSR